MGRGYLTGIDTSDTLSGLSGFAGATTAANPGTTVASPPGSTLDIAVGSGSASTMRAIDMRDPFHDFAGARDVTNAMAAANSRSIDTAYDDDVLPPVYQVHTNDPPATGANQTIATLATAGPEHMALNDPVPPYRPRSADLSTGGPSSWSSQRQAVNGGAAGAAMEIGIGAGMMNRNHGRTRSLDSSSLSSLSSLSRQSSARTAISILRGEGEAWRDDDGDDPFRHPDEARAERDRLMAGR